MVEQTHVTDLLPAYALRSLEPEEAHQVELHLEVCSACQDELEAYRHVTDLLPLGMAFSSPPPELKARLMDEARRQRTASAPQAEISYWHRFKRWLAGPSDGNQRLAAWSIGAVLVIVLLFISNLVLWQRVTRLQANQTFPFRTVLLAGTDYSPQATGLLVMGASGERGSLVVDKLPELDEAHQYQLWLVRENERFSGGVFSTGKSGYGSMYIRSAEPLSSFESFGITIEPAGGSPGPTGQKVLGAALE